MPSDKNKSKFNNYQTSVQIIKISVNGTPVVISILPYYSEKLEYPADFQAKFFF